MLDTTVTVNRRFGDALPIDLEAVAPPPRIFFP
jgi:hypothetical protein